MNRQEFMRQLEYLLSGIPTSEREDALAYYNNYFDEAGVENEVKVIEELGSPEAVAKIILADVYRDGGDYSNPEPEAYEHQVVPKQNRTTKKQGMSQSTKILLIILIVITFPIWIGIVAGLFGAAIGLIGALFGVIVGLMGAVIGLVAGGVGCIIGGIACIIANPIDGLVCVGVGAILAAIGILLAIPCVLAVGVWIPKAIKALVNGIKGILHRKEGGNEI